MNPTQNHWNIEVGGRTESEMRTKAHTALIAYLGREVDAEQISIDITETRWAAGKTEPHFYLGVASFTWFGEDADTLPPKPETDMTGRMK